jgi:transcription-repair coupling factor (superfamily II helicase)
MKADVVLVPATTALYRLAPPAFLAGYTFHFKVKQKLDEAQLRAQLTLAGYQHVTQVVSPGEYAVRGGLIDLFPMGSLQPYRVDLFDDEIDSIRTFDPDSQRSLYPVPEVRLLPGREFPMDDAARARKFAAAGASCWRATPRAAASTRTWATAWPPRASSTTCRCSLTTRPRCSTTWATTPRWCCTATWRPPSSASGRTRASASACCRATQTAPSLPPEALFLSAEQFYTLGQAARPAALRPGVEDVPDSALFQKLADLSVVRGAEDPLAPARAHPQHRSSACCCWPKAMAGAKACWTFCAPRSSIRPPSIRWPSSRPAHGGKGRHRHRRAATGFRWVEEGLDFVTETELFAAGPTTRRRKKQEQVSDVEALIKDLAELNVGDPVVHSQHGIGRYRGLVNMDVGNKNPDGTPALQEFLHLEYADKPRSTCP